MDLYRISQLLFKGGYTQAEIAEIINEGRAKENQISVVTVGRDIKQLRNMWSERSIDNMDFLVNRELARLDHLEAELWKAIGVTRRKIHTVKSTTNNGDSETETVEELPPNPGIFNQILSVQKERRKLLGMYLNTQKVVNVELKGYSIVSPDDWPEVVEGNYKQIGDGE